MKTHNLESAAEKLGIRPTTVRARAAAGEIPGAKFGKSWVFTDEDLDKYFLETIQKQTSARRGEDKPKPPAPAQREKAKRRRSPLPSLDWPSPSAAK